MDTAVEKKAGSAGGDSRPVCTGKEGKAKRAADTMDQEHEQEQQQATEQQQFQENELEQLRSHVSQMEEESAKLQEMQDEMMADDGPEHETGGVVVAEVSGDGGDEAGGEDAAGEDGTKHLSIQERQEIDNRSIYVGNIDYAATPEDVQELFKECGTVNRITILTDRITGTPMGYGFVEFESVESIPKALEHNQALFKGRPLKVIQKRTNVPGFGRGRSRGRGRGRGFRGGFRGRGGRGAFRGGRGGFPRGGGAGAGGGGAFRGSRGGARGGFTPY